MEYRSVHSLSDLPPGSHLCLFYDKDAADLIPALALFVEEALQQNEQLIYVADDQPVDTLAKRLVQQGVPVPSEIQSGRLKLWTRQEWRQQDKFDSAQESLQVRHLIEQAATAGFQGIRFAIEMTWALTPDLKAGQLEYWEATLNTLLSGSFPARILCLYNSQRCPPEILLAALHTHPFAMLQNEVCTNVFYQAPLILDGLSRGVREEFVNLPARLDWMTSQLRRSCAMDKHRMELLHQQWAIENSQRLASIVESSDDAIISKDLNGIITSWNQGAERIFGYTAAEAIGQSITMLIPPDRYNEEPAILERIRRGERIDHYETVRRRKDGQLLNISLTVSPLKDARGKVMGVSKIARDITESKRLEAALRRTNDELEARVAQRTEQLRALALELTRAEERERRRLAQVLHDHLQQLIVASRLHLNTAVQQMDQAGPRSLLLKVSGILEEATTVSRSLTVELWPPVLQEDGLAAGLQWLARWMQQKHGLTVGITVEEGTPVVHGDLAGFLFQAVRELLFNIVKHAGINRATIHLTCSAARMLTVTVADQGNGYDPAESKPNSNRTGFGLFSISERLQFLGGRSEIQSRPGKGTTVTLTIPIPDSALSAAPTGAMAPTNPSLTPPNGPPHASPSNGKLRIVLTDDHQIVRDGLKGILNQRPELEVVGEAADGQTAIELTRRLHPDVVLMDINMPGLNGIETTRALLSEFPHLCIIGLSMHEEADRAEAMRLAGAAAFISKSAPIDALINLLYRHAITFSKGAPVDSGHNEPITPPPEPLPSPVAA